MNVGYLAPLTATGYSQAARSYVMALHMQEGINVHVYLTAEDSKGDFGEEGKLMRKLSERPMPLDKCDVVIHHREPGWCNWVKGVPNICYTVWEADRIPVRWKWILNDKTVEVWVPSSFNVDVFTKCGVNKPVVKVPHIVDKKLHNIDADIQPTVFDKRDLDGRKFIFYMGPWDNRKNPGDLVRAYYKAFTKDDNVILVMRSYHGMHSVEYPATGINNIRLQTPDPSQLPPILFIGSNLPDDDIWWLHRNAFLFASMTHSEGWGLGHSQSLAMEVPVLAPRWGGALEFQNDDNSFLVNVPSLVPTSGFSGSSLYDPNTMRWAQPDVDHAASLLRKAFKNDTLCRQKGKAGRKYVITNFSYEVVGNIMADRLRAITNSNK